VLGALEIPTSGTAEVPGVYDGAWGGSGEILESRCPATGEVLARVKTVSDICTRAVLKRLSIRKATPEELRTALDKAREAYVDFRHVPAPKRGEILRQIREALSAKASVMFTSVYPRFSPLLRNSSAMNSVLWFPLKWARSRQRALARSRNSLIS
jgi:aldehyde dehydrogenase family 7 member A1